MGILKKEPNPVGRPSNESLKKKRNQKILVGVLATVAVLLVGGTVLLVATGTDLTQLMGNSTTKTVRVCPNGYNYNKTTKKCETTKSTIPACPTGGYTLTGGHCEKLKSSTSGIQAVYNSTTKTYNCPSNKSDQWTTTKYVKSGKTTCIKNVYEVKSTVKGCEKGYTLTGGKCVKSTALETLKLSSNNYSMVASYGENLNKIQMSAFEKNIDRYFESFIVELYEIKNGKYNFIENMKLNTSKNVVVDGTKTYATRLKIKDVVTGKVLYTPYKEFKISSDKILQKPKLEEKDKLKENNVYNVELIVNQSISQYISPGESRLKCEIYEVVNGKDVLLHTLSDGCVDQYLVLKIKLGQSKKYKARFVINRKNKTIYSDFSNVFTVDTNKFSS